MQELSFLDLLDPACLGLYPSGDETYSLHQIYRTRFSHRRGTQVHQVCQDKPSVLLIVQALFLDGIYLIFLLDGTYFGICLLDGRYLEICLLDGNIGTMIQTYNYQISEGKGIQASQDSPHVPACTKAHLNYPPSSSHQNHLKQMPNQDPT